MFSWSCRYLDPAAVRLFRLASLHPGVDLDRYAAAALSEGTAEQAGRLLDVLARAYLTEPTRPGRYGMHDLLRGYGAELAAAHDGQDERRAALTRLFDYYLGTSAAAMDTLYAAERHRRPAVPAPVTPAPPVTDPAQARAWLDAERASLVAAAGHTADGGWPGHATRLAATLSRYLDTGGHFPEAITMHTCARRAARHAGDRAAEATALACLGVVGWRQGRFQQARQNLEQALSLYRETGDRTGEARALSNLGDIDRRQGRYQEATSHHRQALALHRETGHRPGEADALAGLGDVLGRQGRGPQAASHFRQALALSRETGQRSGEANALNGLAKALLAVGQPDQARPQHAAALALASQIGDTYQQARAHDGLGACHAACDPGLARRHWQQALILYTSLGAPEAGRIRASLDRPGPP